MGELDRMAQRHLQHWDAELDPLSRDAERAQHDKRVQGGPAAPQRVGHPDPREAALFDFPGVADDATERPAARIGAGAHKGHHAQSHDRLPSERVAVTRVLLSALAGCRARMQQIGGAGQQPIAQTDFAKHDRACRQHPRPAISLLDGKILAKPGSRPPWRLLWYP